MSPWIPAAIGTLSVLAALGLLNAWRASHSDAHDEAAEWQRLAALQPGSPPRFDPAQLADQPEPVQRLFGFLIRPGTPLRTVAQLRMGGDFSLGTAARHRYIPMQARQILASPQGFVWSVRLGGACPMRGSDALGWTRFRAFGLIPLAHLGGSPDHARSAFGRMVAEALFWAPASVLPGPGVVWASSGEHQASVTVTHGALSQTVELQLAEDGRPLTVSFQRWSDANAQRRFQWQPFGGRLADWREVQGFRVPFDVQGINHWGQADAFAFYRAKLQSLRFLPFQTPADPAGAQPPATPWEDAKIPPV